MERPAELEVVPEELLHGFDQLAQVRAIAKTLITVWNARDDVAIECAAELRGALVAIGVLSPADYEELLHAAQRV